MRVADDVSRVDVLRRSWLGSPESGAGADAGLVERFRRRYWLVNVVVFMSLTLPTLLIDTAGWPLRLAATAGLIGACVWEGVALRLRRFPVWADVLETVAVAAIAWRHPTGSGGLVFALSFALLALGFRSTYSTPAQSAVRALTVVAAIYVGFVQSPAGLSRRLPVVVIAAILAFLCVWAVRLIRNRQSVTSGQQVFDRLTGDIAAAKGRRDVHTAMIRAVLELLPDRAEARVIVWDEPESLRPSVAGGASADAVRTGGGEPLTALSWAREALEDGRSVYRESFDVDESRRMLGFEPIGGVVFIVPLRHREQIRALSVATRGVIAPQARAGIEYVARLAEVALGSIELTLEGVEGIRERNYSDPGTRFSNRELLRQRLERALEQADRQVALLLIRVDRFRAIGNSLGNIAGGDALATLNARLGRAVPPHSTIAVLGGDEFAIVVDQVADRAEAEQIAARVMANLDEPLPGLLNTGAGVSVRSSIGVAISSRDARTAGDLLRNAEVAVIVASGAEGESYRVFDPAMRASIVERLELESDLRRALDGDEFELYFQPIVQLHDWGRISGVEALVRWNRPGRGMVPPAQFMTVAEDSGLINQIGTWIMRESCRQQREWAAIRPDLARLTVGVNLSPRQFALPDVAQLIANVISETGADPSRMIFELTESALVETTEANRDKLLEIKAMGIRLALDDFGTGFSALGYLRQFPFDIIKIDRSFIREVDVDEGAAALAGSVIRIAKALDLTSLAEGIETIGQAEWLVKAGCDDAQGYFFARPMPPDQLLPLLMNGLSVAATRP